MSAASRGGRARVRGPRRDADVVADGLLLACRALGEAMPHFFDSVRCLPAALALELVDGGDGSWDEEAEREGVEWDYSARRPGEEWPLDYQAPLYWPEVGPAPVVARGGEHG